MAEKDGYKTIDLVIQEVTRETGAGAQRVRIAIAALNIQTVSFPGDRRARYYSPEDIERIKQWIRSN